MKGSLTLALSTLLSFFNASSGLYAQITGDSPPVVTNQPPVVTVLATKPNAAEDGPVPATFQVARTGDTNTSLTVLYSLGGSARNGSDYNFLPGFVSIPAGATSAVVTLMPIPDRDSMPDTNDTVVLQLHPFIDFDFGRVGPYAIGWPSNAVATIAESTAPVTNTPPVVRLLSPADMAGFVTPVDIKLVAQAADADGTVTNVQFFAGSTSLGSVSNTTAWDFFERGFYSLEWSNAPAGPVVLTAVATDNGGLSSTSAPVHINILSQAQVPTVTVTATDAQASELGPDPGTFTLTRTGDTTGPLAVYYSLGGTARNGEDFQRLSGVVNFAAGASDTNITVVPIPDLDFTPHSNDTVELQLRPLVDFAHNTSGIYNVGSPSNAVVTITEDNTAFPTVTITATDPNASEDGPKPATFQVTRSGNNTSDLTVYYVLGGTARNGQDYQPLPGYVTIPAGAPSTNFNLVPILDIDTTRETNETVIVQLRPSFDFFHSTSGYALGWPSNAVATITESPNAPTNPPPVVRLLSPADGSGFVGPTNILLLAQAKDNGTVTNVQFFADATSLGSDTNASSARGYRGLYPFTWTNAPLGQHTVTVVATDNNGSSSTSAPVHLFVTATALPTVSVFASDPIAYTGTNSMGVTNIATFVVRRTDGTNADLVVNYTLSGTASNGVDYVKLPGTVTIPAGSFKASITVQPLNNPASSNAVQSVILTLQPPPTPQNGTPTYLVGHLSQAAALIINRAAPLFMSGHGDDFFHAVIPAPGPGNYDVQLSNDLFNWENVGTNTSTQGAVHFVDPDTTSSPYRFYRVVPNGQ